MVVPPLDSCQMLIKAKERKTRLVTVAEGVASQEMAGWPIGGSLCLLAILPPSEVSRILYHLMADRMAQGQEGNLGVPFICRFHCSRVIV